MIDISCKFYLQKNDVTNTHYINLVQVIIRQQKVLLTCRELPTVALSYSVCQNQTELLTSGTVFAINMQERFMDNRSIENVAAVNLKKTPLPSTNSPLNQVYCLRQSQDRGKFFGGKCSVYFFTVLLILIKKCGNT